MVTLVKHEWHQCDVQYALELDEDLLAEIYPDMTNEEVDALLKEIENGNVDIDEIIEAAYDNDVDLDWDHQYDNMWTMSKGGYDVTYELGDDDSWVEPQKDPEPTHKCTKCKWKGRSYDAETQYVREDGSVIEDYFNQEEDCHDTKNVCPMCDSDLELTEEGVKEEEKRKEWEAEWEKESAEFDEALENDDELPVPCYSCNALHLESELIEMDGQYICPSCGEGWVMKDMRDDPEILSDEDEVFDPVAELEDAIHELKGEIENKNWLHKCTFCEWTGDWTETETDDDGNDRCPECNEKTEEVKDKTE